MSHPDTQDYMSALLAISMQDHQYDVSHPDSRTFHPHKCPLDEALYRTRSSSYPCAHHIRTQKTRLCHSDCQGKFSELIDQSYNAAVNKHREVSDRDESDFYMSLPRKCHLHVGYAESLCRIGVCPMVSGLRSHLKKRREKDRATEREAERGEEDTAGNRPDLGEL